MGKTFVLFAFALSFAAPAMAEPGDWYKCKPPGSSTITDNHPPAACNGIVPIYVFRQDGTPRDVIQPRPTEAQKREQAEKKRQADECHAQNEAKRHEGDALLQRYPHEEDLRADMDRALAAETARVEQQAQRLEDLAKQRAELEDEKEFYAKNDIPEALKLAFQANDANTDNARRQVERINSEIERIAADFDRKLEWYRELVSGNPKYPCETPAE